MPNAIYKDIMAKGYRKFDLQNLPASAAEFIKLVIKKMRYRKKVRQDVQVELAAHFEDELKECRTDEDREQKAQHLIAGFGDVKLLAVLLRRAKKRCRPLWRTIVARTFQTAGVLILCFIAYTGWFLTGKPTVSVDYLERWNEISKPEIIEGDNAWVNYEKAIELFADPNESLEKIIKRRSIEFSYLDEPEQRQMIQWIEKNEAAWGEFVKGSLRPYYYRKASCGGDPNDPYHNWLLSVLAPHLRPLRDLARLGIWRSKIALESGKIGQSLEDCFAVVRAGSHLQSKGGLIEQLVGIAITKFGYDGILAIMSEQELSAGTLAELHKELQDVYRKDYPEIDIEGERFLFLDTVQHVFTEGGFGGGHLIPRSIHVLDGLTGTINREAKVLRAIAYTGGSMIHARRNETIVQGNKMYDKIAEVLKMSPYERHAQNLSCEDIISALPSHRYFLLPILVPASDRLSQLRFEGKALYEATVTVLAILRYEKEKGEYPNSLRELITAGYLKNVPLDPFSDKPLVYKKTDDDFTLYSVGRDFEDDGGAIARRDDGRIYIWSDEDDAVFWPVSRSEVRKEK